MGVANVFPTEARRNYFRGGWSGLGSKPILPAMVALLTEIQNERHRTPSTEQQGYLSDGFELVGCPDLLAMK